MRNLPTTYDPKDVEERLYTQWESRGYFHAEPDETKKPFTIVIPPPNVTGQLHMGHALDNTLQDILIRWKRMQGYNALWQPGTDHASIATELKVIAKLAEEGINKQDLGREGFLERAWAWKEEYGGRIINQLKKLGSSCDWERERFTMDEGLSDAVLEVFMRLYDKGLIYKGKRIINWCGAYKKQLYLGFVMTFFSHIFTAMPIGLAAYTVGRLIEAQKNGAAFDTAWIPQSILLQIYFVLIRFLFDYLRARLQEPISYNLTARDRLAIGDALKRVSLGYFSQMSTGNILNSITTGLSTLENMGIRMIDNFVGGYLNFLVVFLGLMLCSPPTALIALAAAGLSLAFLFVISHFSRVHAPIEAEANRAMTGAAIEYARGLAVVKSFGKAGAAMESVKEAVRDSKRIHLKIEWGYLPANAGHLLALKCGSVGLAMAAALQCLRGAMDFSMMLLFVFFSFSIFASLEPISDSAHTLGVIDDAMNQLDALRTENFIDADGRDIPLTHHDIVFRNVDFGYDSRTVLKDISFRIPEKTSTAIVGPSGSGKTTICSLIARFYDPRSGSITIGGHDLREFTCDSLLSNISMVFQNVYLFHDTIRANICFGKPDATEEEMVDAAKKARCHDFITALPNGYDTVVGEGGGTLSGGEKQRISIARAILKNAPVIILDEATASIDPENEYLIQQALSALTRDKTVITIAHRLATIESADQILVIDDGRLIQKGTHAALASVPGKYKDFVDIRRKSEGWRISE